VRVVPASQRQLRALGALVAREIKRKHVPVQSLLLDDVVEEGAEVVRRHRRVGQAHDAVEPGLREDVSHLLHDFGEVLSVDLHSTHVRVIGVDFSDELSGAELHVQVVPEVLEGGALGSVVLLVVLAPVIAAASRVDPDVGAAGIEDGLERVGGVSERDFADILGVFEVVELDVVLLLGLERCVQEEQVVVDVLRVFQVALLGGDEVEQVFRREGLRDLLLQRHFVDFVFHDSLVLRQEASAMSHGQQCNQ
jgi:hypothetical protein